MPVERERILGLRDFLEGRLLSIPGSRLNGHPSRRLHNISNISFANADARSLMRSLSGRLAVSNGSACSSLVEHPSHVLKSMALSDLEAVGSLRFSLGRFNTEAEVDLVVSALSDYLGR